jgi:hypothetical protein
MRFGLGYKYRRRMIDAWRRECTEREEQYKRMKGLKDEEKDSK